MLYSDDGGWRWIWMQSTGGPLLLVLGEHLLAWGGIEPPADGRHIEAKFRWGGPDEPATDYDRACDVAGYLGLLDIGAGQGLVLGDEPLGTAWRASAASGGGNGTGDMGGTLIRWVYADSEADVIDAVERVPETAWVDDGLVLSVGREPLYLLDAACDASVLEGGDYLVIHLPVGDYAIATAEYEPDSHTCLLLHRLTRMSSATVSEGG